MTLAFGSLTVQPEAGVFDLMQLLPAELPPLDGVLSLQTFAGHVLTLDLGHDRVEIADARDEAMLAHMQPLTVRYSHSFAGAGLDVFVRVTGTRGPLWLELDSGNLDDVLIADRLVDQLGLAPEQADALRRGEHVALPLQIDGLGSVTVTAAAADLVYDGALNAATLERM